MKNAHLRFGSLGFHKAVGNTVTRFNLHMDRFIGERSPDGISRAHLVSVLGGDTQIAAASAIVSDQQNFSVEGPGLPTMNVNLGKDAQCFRASIQLSTSKRPLRHLIAVSNEFATTNGSGTSGRTILADSGRDFLWSSLSQIFGLPALPEWADWFYQKLDDHLAITPIPGLGLDPVVVTGSKTEFLQWLSEGIQKGEIHFPEMNGPAAWPSISLNTILSPVSEVSE